MKVIKEPFSVGKFTKSLTRRSSVAGSTLKATNVIGSEKSINADIMQSLDNPQLKGDPSVNAPFWSRSFRGGTEKHIAVNPSKMSQAANPQQF